MSPSTTISRKIRNRDSTQDHWNASVLPFSAPMIANTTVTNVRGPTEPMYFHGARLVRVTGMGPLIGDLNLFHVAASYNGMFSIGATVDRKAASATPANICCCPAKAPSYRGFFVGLAEVSSWDDRRVPNKVSVW